MKTVYLAGKITNDPDYKENFKEAEDYFNSLGGYVVLSPTILPDKGFEYYAYIRMSMAMLNECEAVCMIPGWHESQGAKSEYEYATTMGREIFYFDGEKHI